MDTAFLLFSNVKTGFGCFLINDNGYPRGQIQLLFVKYLKYLVDTMRDNQVIWGVGRGSSVASYVLYLIGIHKIDSMYYDLPINEFLR